MKSLLEFCQKLKALKKEAIKWTRNKKRAKIKMLVDYETKLGYYNDPLDPLYFSVAYREKILKLEGEKRKKLLKEEEEWKLKSLSL